MPFGIPRSSLLQIAGGVGRSDLRIATYTHKFWVDKTLFWKYNRQQEYNLAECATEMSINYKFHYIHLYTYCLYDRIT